jgi:hypothetical protein
MISVNKVDDMGPGRLSVGSCSERLEALEEQSEASPAWSINEFRRGEAGRWVVNIDTPGLDPDKFYEGKSQGKKLPGDWKEHRFLPGFRASWRYCYLGCG